MNSNIAIRAENISKQYRLGEVGTGTISHDLNRFWAKLRGKEDPYLKIGENIDRNSKGGSDYVWSLRDINFEVEKGDAVGIIGRNGAGKSTLLKLLSRVTKPTTGHFEVNGRMASLLEVGTGFNPEMTGRENIFLNGAILGMRRHEIKRKFDEIVDFAGVERYIDTPVKRYSSGMYVRLAFAVAAHLESEILIVDEVLAVGDAEFQKKCLGKMSDVSKGEGRTVLFVSHNMAAVQNLCNKGIVLKNGKVEFKGDTNNCILNYYQNNIISHSFNPIQRTGNGKIRVSNAEIRGKDNSFFLESGKNFDLKVSLDNPTNYTYSQIIIDIIIEDNFGAKVGWLSTYLKPCNSKKIAQKVIFELDKLLLVKGVYSISIEMSADRQLSDLIINALVFSIDEANYFSNSRNIPSGQSKNIMDFKILYQ